MWHACCKHWGAHAKLEPPRRQLCFWAVESNGRAWETMRKWGRWSLRWQTYEVVSGISFMIEDLLPVRQPQNVTAACLLFLTLAPPSVGYNKRRPSSSYEWHCGTPTLWFMMVIRRYNQWNKKSLMPPALQKMCGSNASAEIETIKASAECV